jgi:SAM-dependent methyltransferase
MRTESVPCPLCGALETRRLYQGDGFAMGRCRGCGLVRQNPRLSAEALVLHYRRAAELSGELVHRRSEDESLPDWLGKPMEAYEASVRFVDARRRADGPRGLWIDVGASTGGTLVTAQRHGWRVAGVELGERQAAVCRDLHGLDVVHGTLAQASYPTGHAEVVSYRQVLEHVHDPVAELTEARRVLSKDGLLLVEVPHWGGVRYRSGRIRAALRVSRPFWERVNVPEHLFYFTRATLAALLAKAGFVPLAVTTYGKTRPRAGIVRRSYDRLRDALHLGNKLRVVAAKSS